MGDVVTLNVETNLPIPVDRVLDGARDMECVLVLGFDKEGNFTAATSLGGDGTKAVSLAQRFVHKYYAGDYDT